MGVTHKGSGYLLYCMLATIPNVAFAINPKMKKNEKTILLVTNDRPCSHSNGLLF
jgi:hypothetical protein